MMRRSMKSIQIKLEAKDHRKDSLNAIVTAGMYYEVNALPSPYSKVDLQ